MAYHPFTKEITISDVLQQIENKLVEVEYLEKSVQMNSDELSIVKRRLDAQRQFLHLRAEEMRRLMEMLQTFVTHEIKNSTH